MWRKLRTVMCTTRSIFVFELCDEKLSCYCIVYMLWMFWRVNKVYVPVRLGSQYVLDHVVDVVGRVRFLARFAGIVTLEFLVKLDPLVELHVRAENAKRNNATRRRWNAVAVPSSSDRSPPRLRRRDGTSSRRPPVPASIPFLSSSNSTVSDVRRRLRVTRYNGSVGETSRYRGAR